MAEYYLISQLPSLDTADGNVALPITEERFLELCTRFLGKKALFEFSRLSIIPPREPYRSDYAIINAWNDGERSLRLALAAARAERMNKQFSCDTASLPPALLHTARSAAQAQDPFQAEKLLNDHRLAFLETLRPSDCFSLDQVFYYFLRLKLLERIKQFDTASGKAAYRNIYASIVNGGSLGGIQ